MLNKVFLQGRLTAEPEVKHTQSGVAVCTFSLAVDGVRDKPAQFFRCNAWDKGADIAMRLHKGEMTIVEGSVEIARWKDKTGAEKTAPQVRVERIHFCGQPRTETVAEEDMPF